MQFFFFVYFAKDHINVSEFGVNEKDFFFQIVLLNLYLLQCLIGERK